MKATDLVLSQHREVKQLFEQLETNEGDKKAAREELAQNLVAHAVIEQEYLYPAMKEVLRDEVERSYIEHGLVAYALSQLISTRPTDESFQARVTVIRELTEKHIREEETEMLKKAESTLGQERLMRMGEEMEARFEQLKAKGYKSLLRQALAECAPGTAGRRAAPKKTAAKATTGTQRATQRHATTRQAPEARQTAKRGATQTARKGASGGQKPRNARAPR